MYPLLSYIEYTKGPSSIKNANTKNQSKITGYTNKSTLKYSVIVSNAPRKACEKDAKQFNAVFQCRLCWMTKIFIYLAAKIAYIRNFQEIFAWKIRNLIYYTVNLCFGSGSFYHQAKIVKKP
jgi:hypothetical protein